MNRVGFIEIAGQLDISVYKINVLTRLNKSYMDRLYIQRKELYQDILFFG